MSKIITDPYLGNIQYSKEHDWYEGRIKESDNRTIEFFLADLDIEENLKEALEYAQKTIQRYY